MKRCSSSLAAAGARRLRRARRRCSPPQGAALPVAPYGATATPTPTQLLTPTHAGSGPSAATNC